MDVRILIVDDHPTVREALRFVFAAAGMKQIMEATTCRQAVEAVRDHHVDVLLLDLALGDSDGLVALRKIKSLAASLPVLIHSYHDYARWLAQALRSGAAGYLVKGQDKNVLIQAVRQSAAGANLWTEEQMNRIREAEADANNDRSAQRSADCGQSLATSTTNR